MKQLATTLKLQPEKDAALGVALEIAPPRSPFPHNKISVALGPARKKLTTEARTIFRGSLPPVFFARVTSHLNNGRQSRQRQPFLEPISVSEAGARGDKLEQRAAVWLQRWRGSEGRVGCAALRQHHTRACAAMIEMNQ